MNAPLPATSAATPHWTAPALAVALHVAAAAAFALMSVAPAETEPAMVVELVALPPPPQVVPVVEPAQPAPVPARTAPRPVARPAPQAVKPAPRPAAAAPASAPSVATAPPQATATVDAAPSGHGTAPAAPVPAAEEAPYQPPMGRAGYLDNPRPAYPLVARKRGIEGVVRLMVEVDEDGRARTVEICASSGHGMLDQSAVEAVRAWRFVPARRAGRAIAASVEVPIRFSLRGEG